MLKPIRDCFGLLSGGGVASLAGIYIELMVEQRHIIPLLRELGIGVDLLAKDFGRTAAVSALRRARWRVLLPPETEHCVGAHWR